MRRTRFDQAPCPIARSTDLLGDWWTPLVMREACSGVRRFEVFQERLDIPRATLATRLDRLVDEGLLRRARYQDHPPRDEYRLTRKGAELFPVLAAMFQWGNDWLFEPAHPAEEGSDAPGGAKPDGAGPTVGWPPLMLVDAETGAELRPIVVDEATGEPIDVRRTRVQVRRS